VAKKTIAKFLARVVRLYEREQGGTVKYDLRSCLLDSVTLFDLTFPRVLAGQVMNRKEISRIRYVVGFCQK